MANTIRTYTGDGALVLFPVDFDLGYIRREYVYVYEGEDYTQGVAFTWINDGQIQLAAPTAVGVKLHIRRIVPRNVIVNDYQDNAIMHEQNLDDSFRQSLMVIEEIQDGYLDPVGEFVLNSNINLQDTYRVINAADPVHETDLINLRTMRQFVLDEQGGLALVNRAETAAVKAETSETNTTNLYYDFRQDYMGNGGTFPTPNKEGSLFYYDGANFTQGLYISYSNTNDPFTGTWGLVSGVGPQGATGAQGVQGPDGVKGEQGIEGPQGIQGQQGIQGAIGDTGPSGIKGETGDTGPQGIQGVVGPVGAVGGQGPTGAEGPVGAQGIQGVIGVKGNVGDEGPQGATGPTGPQGIEGPEGVVGPVGVRGPQGIQGLTGEQGNRGATGEQGIQGVGIQGATGPQGTQGEVGPRGPIGPLGLQGIQGAQGDDGPEGPVGPQGIQGVGIVGPTGPQGTQGNPGPQGIQGIDGQSFNIDVIGTIAGRDAYNSEATDFKYYATDYSVTADANPDFDRFVSNGVSANYTLSFTPDGPQSVQVQVGGVVQGPDRYTVSVTNEVYMVSLSSVAAEGLDVVIREFSIATGYGAIFIKQSAASGDWSPAIPFGRGPRGDQGIDGNQGVTGPQGATGGVGPAGPIGPQGIKGVKGATGSQGPQGETGTTGPIGAQGIQGIVGPQGAIGGVGPAGPDGDQGITGAQGIPGVQGPIGLTGPDGAIGPQGPTGTVGPQGATGGVGPKGSTGATGDVGARGATGPQGPTGDQGSIGPEGAEGVQGPAGIVGPQGATGNVGPQGQKGNTGDRGPVGIQGAEGDRGPTGVQGPQGNLGATGPQGAQGPVGAKGARGDQGSTGPTGGVGPTGGKGATGSAGANGKSSSGQVWSPSTTVLYPHNTKVLLKTWTRNSSEAFNRSVITSNIAVIGISGTPTTAYATLSVYHDDVFQYAIDSDEVGTARKAVFGPAMSTIYTADNGFLPELTTIKMYITARGGTVGVRGNISSSNILGIVKTALTEIVPVANELS